jgi:hypothetical protein
VRYRLCLDIRCGRHIYRHCFTTTIIIIIVTRFSQQKENQIFGRLISKESDVLHRENGYNWGKHEEEEASKS